MMHKIPEVVEDRISNGWATAGKQGERLNEESKKCRKTYFYSHPNLVFLSTG